MFGSLSPKLMQTSLSCFSMLELEESLRTPCLSIDLMDFLGSSAWKIVDSSGGAYSLGFQEVLVVEEKGTHLL